MKKVYLLVSLTLALSMVLAACSAGPSNNPTPTAAGTTSTETTGGVTTTEAATTAVVAPTTEAAVTAAATESPMATETSVVATVSPLTTETPVMATAAPTSTSTTGTGVLPNTGSTGADRLSNMLRYPVIGQNGQDAGQVADVVVNLGTSMVDYVIIQPAASMQLGNVYIPVPYSAMTVRTYEGAMNSPQGTAMPAATETAAMSGTMSTTGVMATATAGAATSARNLAFYLNVDDNTLKNAPHFTGLPEVSASSWNEKMNAYWSKISGGTTAPAVTSTAVATTTVATPAATATTAASVSSATTATATAGATTGSAANGMKGNILGSALLTYRLNDSATPGVGKVSDAIVDLATGRIMYLLVSGGTTLGLGNKVALIPLQVFRYTPGESTFTFQVPLSVVSKAPLYSLNELPDFTANNWDSELNSYWQSNMGSR